MREITHPSRITVTMDLYYHFAHTTEIFMEWQGMGVDTTE